MTLVRSFAFSRSVLLPFFLCAVARNPLSNELSGNYGLSRIGFDATGNSYGRYRFVANTFFASTAQKLGFTVWGTVVSASFYDNIFYLPGSGALTSSRSPIYLFF